MGGLGHAPYRIVAWPASRRGQNDLSQLLPVVRVASLGCGTERREMVVLRITAKSSAERERERERERENESTLRGEWVRKEGTHSPA